MTALPPADQQIASADLAVRLAQARQLFDQLYAQYSAGEIDAASFEAARRSLTVPDGRGGFWAPGLGGGWLYYDGYAWQPARPPLETIPAAPPAPPAHTGRRARRIALVAVIVALLVFGLAIALLCWQLSTPQENGTPAEPPATATVAIPAALLATPAPLPADELPAATDPRIILDEDFSADGGRWPTDADERRRTTLADGQYTIEVLQPDYAVWRTYGSAQSTAYLLVADVMPLDEHGGSHGLVVLQSDAGYYCFEVDTAGRYRLRLRHDDAWQTALDWTASDALSQGVGPNRLAVNIVDGGLTLYANGERLATHADEFGLAGRPGLMVAADEDTPQHAVAFDNLIQYAPLDGPVPYSDEQMSLILDAGLPQSFALVQFEIGEGARVRHETWSYHDAGLSFLFEDGQYATWQEAEALPPSAQPNAWRPEQFPLGTSPAEIGTAFPAVSWELIGDEELYGMPLTLRTDGQVVLGYYQDELVLVHAHARQGEAP